jgi:hypothetical protein
MAKRDFVIEPIYMNSEEAAKYLMKTKSTLAQWRCHGVGPAYIPGRPAVYLKADLDAFQHGRRIVPTLNRQVA